MGRLTPHLIFTDAVIPRTKLPEILETIHGISEKYGVVVCNVFHAGDGNLHPNIAYSADDPAESERVHKAMTEIMRACIDAGGSITGEHGVGLDNRGTWRRSSPTIRSTRCASCAQCSILTPIESRQGGSRSRLQGVARGPWSPRRDDWSLANQWRT